MSIRDWTDLPLLPSIADRLDLISLLRFRAVCKDWKSASSTASAEIEALPHHQPWFLVYGENDSQCILVTERPTTKHTIDLPQLNGTTCLASSHGWLLLFREGSMFFFCPLSRAKIDLPGPFPHAAISNHVALFSAPPTSKDCVVGVISQTETEIKLHTVGRGETYWTEHTLASSSAPEKIRFSGYHDGRFLFVYNRGSVVHFLIKQTRLYRTKLRYAEKDEKCIPLVLGHKTMRDRLMGLDLDGSEISICGTTLPLFGDKGQSLEEMVPHENNGVGYKRQGVWFQPRFHQISENQIW